MLGERWERRALDSPVAAAALAEEVDAGPLSGRLALNQDPRWLATLVDAPAKTLCACVCLAGGRLVGLASFIVHPADLPLKIGPVSVIKRRTRQFEAFAPPAVHVDPDDVDGEKRLLRGLFAQLRADAGPRDMLFLSGIADGSTLHSFLIIEPREMGFACVQHGPFYPHRLAKVGAGFDDYLASLGSRTRADLRTTRKKFIAATKGAAHTRCFRAPDDVDEFIRDATIVSRKTWQYQRLDAGLRDAEALSRQFHLTARLGWFRSYIVYVGETPIAFQVGHVYAGVFHAQDTGYDPDWAYLSAGIFQHTEIMTDLAADGAVRWFDFDRGDFSHKQRLATESQSLGYFHLIPATLTGRSWAVALLAADRISRAVGTGLDRLGLRKRAHLLSQSGVRGQR